jgi:cobalt/nickel transport system ATP-binding protein
LSREKIIDIKDLAFGFPEGRTVFESLDFEVFRHDRLALSGDNGSGKTTLFRLILGLLKAKAGKINIFGEDRARERDFMDVRRRIGFLFQNPDDQLFCPTVLDEVVFGPLNLGLSKAGALEIARKTLNRLELGGYEQHVTFKLSGGEKKLVALAAVLAMNPEVLLLDEPTSSLDENTRERLSRILKESDRSMVIISHDHEFIEHLNLERRLLKDGRIISV